MTVIRKNWDELMGGENAQSQKSEPVCAVVGANGFIGSAITTEFLNFGLRVNRITRQTHNDFCKADPYWFEACDVIIYAGGRTPARATSSNDFRENLNALKKILSAAEDSQVKQVILLSSASVYGVSRESPLSEFDELAPDNSYGRMCVEAEFIAHDSVNQADLMIVRPFNVYGPGGYGLVDNLLGAAKTKTKLELHGANSIRDYIGVEQVARSVVRLLRKKGIVNIGTGLGRKTSDVVELAQSAHPVLKDLIFWSGEPPSTRNKSVADIKLAKKLRLPIDDRLPSYIGGNDYQ